MSSSKHPDSWIEQWWPFLLMLFAASLATIVGILTSGRQ